MTRTPMDQARALRDQQDRFGVRADVLLALGEVYAGAESLEADALLDQLDRRGLRVVRA